MASDVAFAVTTPAGAGRPARRRATSSPTAASTRSGWRRSSSPYPRAVGAGMTARWCRRRGRSGRSLPWAAFCARRCGRLGHVRAAMGMGVARIGVAGMDRPQAVTLDGPFEPLVAFWNPNGSLRARRAWRAALSERGAVQRVTPVLRARRRRCRAGRRGRNTWSGDSPPAQTSSGDTRPELPAVASGDDPNAVRRPVGVELNAKARIADVPTRAAVRRVEQHRARATQQLGNELIPPPSLHEVPSGVVEVQTFI